MNPAASTMHQLRRHRNEPLWKILASANSVAYIAILFHVLGQQDKQLPFSALQERVHRSIEALRDEGESLPLLAKDYIAQWRESGWLARKLPEGAQEEIYELTTDVAQAIRFAMSLLKPRSLATESRLSMVIDLLRRLEQETDANPINREIKLLDQISQLQMELAAVRRGEIKVLPDDRAFDSIREVLAQSEDIASDFGRYRDGVCTIDRDLRRSLIEGDDTRHEVLSRFFDSQDVLATTEEGRTFYGFWDLLRDVAQRGELETTIEHLLQRPFAQKLTREDRRKLTNFSTSLMDGASSVHREFGSTSRSLNSFVRNQEFIGHRRFRSLIREASASALQAKDLCKPNSDIGIYVTLSQVQLSSVGQLCLHEVGENKPFEEVTVGEDSQLSLEEVTRSIMGSEIDFRVLRENIHDALQAQHDVSVGDLMKKYPAKQGIGSLLGYMSLGVKGAWTLPEKEFVSWIDQSGNERSALIPMTVFTRERHHELNT